MKKDQAKTTKQFRILVFLVVALFLLNLVLVFSLFYPGTKTFKSGTRWTPNPSYRNGLNSTFTLGTDFTFQNISYIDHSLQMMKDNVGYWINITSGNDTEITVDNWFESSDPGVELDFQTSGVFDVSLYVGTKPMPTSVTGVSSWTYNATTYMLDFNVSTPDTVEINWAGSYAFSYTFRGLFNETTGLRINKNVTVTAYFIGAENSSESFVLNGTYLYTPTFQPYYFHYELGTYDREYWISPTETSASIYVFNETLTTYTIKFLDLAGVLNNYPYVEAKRYINGTLRIVEKRKVDVEKKIQANLMQGSKYTIQIRNGASYTFGDLLFTSETTVTLTLKGIEFPQDIILAYRYNRIYAYRHNNQSSVSIAYEDVNDNLADVRVDIQFANGTSISGTYPYWYYDVTAFNHTYASAVYNTTYVVQVMIYHSSYGNIPYNAVFGRGWGGQPFRLPFGEIAGINTADIIPGIIIFACFIIFSQINAPVGAFIGVIVAILLTWLGWISIPSTMLVSALTFAFLYALAHSKRKG